MTMNFVAEVSSNHHQDLARCLRFVDVAAQIGCRAVKFQLFKVEDLFSPEVFLAKPEVARRKAWELPVAYLPALAARCRELGIQFSATPFSLEAVGQLAPHVDFYKVASYELLWHDLLRTCARTGKPVVLSTGMANMDEIAAAVGALRETGCNDLTLLHCTSGYPTPAAQCNLAAIQTLRETFGCKVGWSDHSADPGVVDRAIHRWGAEMVEFHLDLDGQGDEFKTGHCWLPEAIAPVIRAATSGISADGSGRKEPVPAELSDREWRADPSDGLRPLKSLRSSLKGRAA
jgi:N-acetylneuraminate synthase